ncbi:hypothetical protein, partial [Streptomyces harbinensis]
MTDITDTHCPYCALQCAMGLARNGDGEDGSNGAGDGSGLRVVERGALCGKGATATAVLRPGAR